MIKKYVRVKSLSLSIIFMLLFLTICFSCKLYVASAEEDRVLSHLTTYETYAKNERLYKLTKAHIEAVMDTGLTIADVKTLSDFDVGNYTLFELDPIGYIIYHGDSGQFVEYASSSVSPYKDYDGELYYGGIMQYYYRNGNNLQHTLRDDVSIPYQRLRNYAKSSREISTALCDEMKLENLAYIEGVRSLSPDFLKGETVVAGASSEIMPQISMEDFFGNLITSHEIGYRNGGICGYIATNLMIGYNYFAYDRGLINDSSFVDENNKTMNGAGLTNYLLGMAGQDYNENSFPGTAANDAYGYMRNYFDTIHPQRSWTHGWHLFKISAKDSIEAGHPVSLYGNFRDAANESEKINHAVVAYGYEDGHFIVHFGHPGYPRVSTAGGLIGTTYYMNLSD